MAPTFAKRFRLDNGLKRLPGGWRRLAILNVTIMITLLIVLLVTLAIAASATGELARAWPLYNAKCKGNSTGIIDILLHLVINTISTAILASSNFFMQILNSPSREEVDTAHRKNNWLDIGIPSLRNAFYLSYFKFIAWFLLFLTSIPIHVFFNSTIFLMDNRSGDYHVTIATENFTSGGNFYLPGASLMTTDLFTPDTGNRNEPASFLNKQDFGAIHSFQDYVYDNFEEQSRKVRKAAASASQWERLEASECQKLYDNELCTGVRGYRDVVLVTTGADWTRKALWSLAPDSDNIWEPVVPQGMTNSVWFSTQCNMVGHITSGTVPSCNASCSMVFKSPNPGEPWLISIGDWYKVLRFKSATSTTWNTSVYSSAIGNHHIGLRFNSFDTSSDLASLRISHCLAEPVQSACSVALSKTSLLIVVLSVLTKIVICIVVIRVLGPREPLVTLGDAIASFITNPVRGAHERGLLTLRSIRHDDSAQYSGKITAQQWTNKRFRRASAVPWEISYATYGIFTASVIVCLLVFLIELGNNIPLKWMGLRGKDPSNVVAAIQGNAPFMSSVIVANTPHLYLSFWYLAYNSIVTRLEMSREWAMFSVKYRPLRVTRPQGQQIGTYRLQLPYKYSAALMFISVMMHWLMSLAIFVVASQGDYYLLERPGQTGDLVGYVSDQVSLPEGAIVAIGVAALPVLLLTIFGAIITALPIVLSTRYLPGYMPVVGSNSRAIAAASQISPLAKVTRLNRHNEVEEDGVELEDLMSESNDSGCLTEEIVRSDSQANIAFRLLKWGEVQMPERWYHRMNRKSPGGEDFGHLSFGTILDDPRHPLERKWYV